MKNIKAKKLYISKSIQEAKVKLFELDEDDAEARMLKNRIAIWLEYLTSIKDIREES